MRTFANAVCRMLMVVAVGALLAACASTGEAKAPEPGSKKWYAARLAEIETAKAEGKLTEQEYLTLKNEADDTRQEYISASRSRDYPPVGIGLGFGVYHHHH
jgi:hypothetical protein